jgi:uncharacterized membrane protein
MVSSKHLGRGLLGSLMPYLILAFLGSQVNHFLFTYHCHNTHVFLLVYVDDIIVIGNNDGVVTNYF